MNGIDYALRRIHSGERSLATELMHIAERHHAEHEVHHVARDLAEWSRDHVRLLAEYGTRYKLKLDADLRQATAEPTTASAPGIQLLEDLAHLYLQASDNSLAWEMLAQVAQAKHEKDLLALTGQCHPQNLRQIRWANTMIKTLTPQALSSL